MVVMAAVMVVVVGRSVSRLQEVVVMAMAMMFWWCGGV
jgi:hypothetical protein